MNKKRLECPQCGSRDIDYTLSAGIKGQIEWHCECKECRHRWDELREPRIDFISTVDNKGRIIIPSDVRKKRGISAGDRMRVIEMEKVKK